MFEKCDFCFTVFRKRVAESYCTNLDKLCRIYGNLLGKKVLAKEKYMTYNPGHNILELYNILVQVRFTTSKTKLYI